MTETAAAQPVFPSDAEDLLQSAAPEPADDATDQD